MLRTAGRLSLLLCVLFSGSAWVEAETAAMAPAQELYAMGFPLDGPHSFADTFGAPRDGNRLHQGIDIFAKKLTPVLAVADGTVRSVTTGERAGRYIVVDHDDGWVSYYLHLNNDTAGTDDGLLDEGVPGIAVGAKVQAGDLLDYVGDSGNAESTPSHLHFELHRPGGPAVNPYPHLLAADGASTDRVEAALETTDEFLAATGATAVVGHVDPGGGFAAGIAVHNDTAFLGTWGRPEACPASGVRMIDVSDPTNPEVVGVIADGEEFPETDTDSVWVGTIATDSFSGDIAVVAVSLCDNRERSRRDDGFRGLAVYDVTDPGDTQLLSTVHSGELTQGVHSVDAAVRADGRVLVAATVMQSFVHTEGEQGDLRLIDITDPSSPADLADWDFRRDASGEDAIALLEEVDEEQLHAHTVSFTAQGERLWVANWDAGAVMLDVTNPAEPAIANWIWQLASAEGDVHSVVSDVGMGVVILSSEDLYPRDEGDHEAGWGYQTVLDLTGKPISQFAAGGAPTVEGATGPLDGYHTAHNAQLIDGRLYSSWYSSGLRIVDLSDPAAPVEIGSFVPPPTVDPQGYWFAPDGSSRMAMVWEVRVSGDLIFVSDMNSGLWIVRYLGDEPGDNEPY
jgi:hypothetical protein